MVEITSQNTPVLGLTSNITPNNFDETMYATPAAKIIIQLLEILTSSEQQEKAFTTAMSNLLFRNVVI